MATINSWRKAIDDMRVDQAEKVPKDWLRVDDIMAQLECSRKATHVWINRLGSRVERREFTLIVSGGKLRKVPHYRLVEKKTVGKP
jgi:hypothetical protein